MVAPPLPELVEPPVDTTPPGVPIAPPVDVPPDAAIPFPVPPPWLEQPKLEAASNAAVMRNLGGRIFRTSPRRQIAPTSAVHSVSEGHEKNTQNMKLSPWIAARSVKMLPLTLVTCKRYLHSSKACYE